MTVDKTANRKKAFTILFMIEMWERFGYYGMVALMVLFMTKALGYDDDKALLTWGAFSGLVYALPSLGGWIGDKILGARRTMTLGALVLALGYILLSIPNKGMLFFALGVIAVGNGLFKANPNNLVSKLYEDNPAQLDGAFTIYYMAVNIGALISMAITPVVAAKWGWHTAFAVSWVGLLLGLLNYFFMRKILAHVGSAPDALPLDLKKLGLVIVGALVAAVAVAFVVQHQDIARALIFTAAFVLLAIFTVLIIKGNASERNGIIVVMLLTVQTMLFFIFYQQMATSLTLFASRNVDLHLFGMTLEPAQFQTFNPAWIFILSPILAWGYNKLNQGRGDFSIATKFAVGFGVVSIAFFIFSYSVNFASAGKVSSWWMVWGYALLSLGELLISGLGLAMVSRYVPGRLRGFMMGAWFLATGISQYLGGYVALIASAPKGVTDPLVTLPLYGDLFYKLGLLGLGGAVIAVIMIPLLKKLSEKHQQQNDPTSSQAIEVVA